MLNKKIIGIMICIIFFGASVVSGINGNIGKKIDTTQIEEYKSSSSSTTDWWPMFHHDLQNTGYSTSKAPDTNNVLWDYTTSGWMYSSPSVADGKVYIGSFDYKVYCLNADNGAWIWDYTTGASVFSSPAVYGGKVYIGSADDNVYCLDADTGAWIWDYTTGDFVQSSPAVYDDKVYIGSFDGYVYCLNADTGAWIWDYTTSDWVTSSPAVADGKVYIGSYDNKVYCLNADNGAWIWDYTTGASVFSSPAVYGGKVYIGSYDNKVYCLDADTGAWIWDYTTSNWVYSSPAVADGKVFIGSNDDKVYAFKNPNQPPYAPTITGPTSGRPNELYSFVLNSVDPDEDDVRYQVDWGDGENDTTSFKESGTDMEVSHSWSETGTYTVTVKAEDIYGAISEETIGKFIVKKGKSINNPFLNWLQSHPNWFLLLQKLIQQLNFGL